MMDDKSPCATPIPLVLSFTHIFIGFLEGDPGEGEVEHAAEAGRRGDGGVFRATLGLVDRFGPQRVRDTPLAEAAISMMRVPDRVSQLRKRSRCSSVPYANSGGATLLIPSGFRRPRL